MSKGLEALEKIDHTICLAFNENNNALFNKDKFEHIDCKDIEEFVDCYDTIEKELKALEIIRNKDVCVELLRYWWKCNYSDKDILKKYNYMHHWKQLTQEEYDLLKEIFKS